MFVLFQSRSSHINVFHSVNLSGNIQQSLLDIALDKAMEEVDIMEEEELEVIIVEELVDIMMLELV